MEQSTDYAELLQKLLKQKSEQNPRYSLRAFARDLGIAPSILSEAFNRRHKLSQKSIEKITLRLNAVQPVAETQKLQ